MTFLSLILPVHNEEDIIEKVLREIIETLNSCKITYEILLIENGSSDNSPKVVIELSKKYNNVHSFVSPKGYGNAVLKGLKQSRGKYVCYMPSDGQVEMSVLPKLLNEVNLYDVVKAKRLKRENIVRDLTTWIFSRTISLLFNTQSIDINGSPRIFLRKHLSQLKLQSKDSFIDAEFLIKISKLNWRIKEFSMKNAERYGGKSTRSINTYLEFFRNIIDYRFSSKVNDWYGKINIKN